MVIGDHPFSKLPKSSGHIDSTPNVLIVSGQNWVVCRTADTTRLIWFIHLRFMPEQEIWGSVNGGAEGMLYGTAVTFATVVPSPPGMMGRHLLKIRVGNKTYESITIVTACQLSTVSDTAANR